MPILENALQKASPDKAGFAICEALNINPNGVSSVAIDIKPTSATATITKHITRDDLEGIKIVIKRSGFVEIVPGAELEELDNE